LLPDAPSEPAPPAEPHRDTREAARGSGSLPSAPHRPSAKGPLLATLITTAVVTAVSYFASERYAATMVGVSFLAATWWLVLRRDEDIIQAYGLSLGGLLESTPLDPLRLARAGARALVTVVPLIALIFPAFWVGYRMYWHPHLPFTFRLPPSIFDEVAGQLVVIALPEEAFFRGFLQTSLDRAFPPRWRILGADLGLGWIAAAAIFAVGHLLTIRHPARLAVFFPALVFGWLRARTGGIGAPVLFHASCNLFSAMLMRGYGISP
jgi:membrane protease YdiL (CAAX protease family)